MDARWDGDESHQYHKAYRTDLFSAIRAVRYSQRPATQDGYSTSLTVS